MGFVLIDLQAVEVLLVLLIAISLMLRGVRYDMVGLGVMVALVLMGLVSPAQAFSGFSSSAVIVIAAAFVMSNALVSSGLLARVEDALTEFSNPFLAMFFIVLVATVFSAFISDVATVAILIPLSVRVSRRFGVSPSKFLMPLAFAAILAGRLTIIGSSVNLVISQFVYQTTGRYLTMFEITPVGGAAVAFGLVFIAAAWFFLPSKASAEAVQVDAYLTECRVNSDFPGLNSKLVDLIDQLPGRVLGIQKGDSLVRGLQAMWETVEDGDVLVIRAVPEEISSLSRMRGLELVPKVGKVESGSLQEAVVMPSSPLSGSTIASVDVKGLYGMTVLGVARKGLPTCQRLSKLVIQPGDVLLLQGVPDQPLSQLGLMPAMETGLSLMTRRSVGFVLLGFITAIALSSLTPVPISIAFIIGVLVMVGSGAVSPRMAYSSVEWQVIIMIGSFFSLATAMQASGASKLIASVLFLGPFKQPLVALFLLYLVSMLVANAINYVAAAMIMAPVSVTLALSLGLSPVPFLIDVMMATSTVFVTPMSHGANLMVLSPGAYDFSDYVKVGLPLALLLMVVTVLVIPLFFPLVPPRGGRKVGLRWMAGSSVSPFCTRDHSVRAGSRVQILLGS